jgi:hypothetical protein
VSPILVRPVREQFEHDRVIRVLQAKYKRKYEVAINPGTEQNASVGVGDLAMYPDLVLFSQERGRKIHGTVEVETTESINTLEAMAEWGPFSRLRTPFFLYVPANTIDTVRRLCSEHAIDPAEIWTYHTALDQVRFTMVHRSADPPKGTINEFKPKPAAPVVTDEPEEAAAVADAAKPKNTKSVAAKTVARPMKAARNAKTVAKTAAKTVKPAKAKAVKPTKAAKAVKSSAKSARSAKSSSAKAKKSAKRR